MSDLIYRHALRKILENWRDACAYVDNEQGCGLIEDVTWELDEQPTVDAVPVQRGKWGKLYADTEPAAEAKQVGFLCSKCMFKRDIDADFGRAIACPNCGARMDGGDSDEAD